MEPSIIHNKSAERNYKKKKKKKLFKKIYKPKNLTIVTVCSAIEKTLLENGLDSIGIKDYVALHTDFRKPWKDTNKVQFIHDYLNRGLCRTRYLLYCDANDVIINDLRRPFDLIRKKKCDLLFMSTKAVWNIELCLNIKEWADSINMGKGRYLNAGIFIGKADFIQEVFGEALKYVTENDLDARRQLYSLGCDQLLDMLPDFPKGCGCDQTILRFIHKKFYPRMQIDYDNELAYRNEGALNGNY